MVSSKVDTLFEGNYFAFFSDGTFGHSDGVGYVGETPAEEVLSLYRIMQKVYSMNKCVFCEKDGNAKDSPEKWGTTWAHTFKGHLICNACWKKLKT